MFRCSPALCLTVALVPSCFSDNPVGTLDTDNGSSSSTTLSVDPTNTGSTGPQPGTTTLGDSSSSDESSSGSTGTTGEMVGCGGENCAVDILVVVDNSGTMALEQAQIGRAMAGLEAGLRERQLDVQVMFTTVDNDNPFCTPFSPEGYTPAMGSPISTSCTERLDDFSGLGAVPVMVPEACTTACPIEAAPQDDPFVAFYEGSDNVPDVTPTDIDGDGVDDSPAAMTMACLAPQGINGCAYESPLEAMLQTLASTAPWNEGPRPFLRPDATLAVVVVTDEADCSLSDVSAMENESFYETYPVSGMPAPSSAICWNAGVDCSGPDVNGEYDCSPAAGGPLHPVQRYTGRLIDELRETEGKDIVMLGIVGVPSVTAHAPDSPFEAEAGGVADLVYRDWEPADILPSELLEGVTAADHQFEFGIGPGCTRTEGGEAQAIPPSRLQAVCESLDEGPERTDLRCCLESVCDDDYSGATRCLLGLLDNLQED